MYQEGLGIYDIKKRGAWGQALAFVFAPRKQVNHQFVLLCHGSTCPSLMKRLPLCLCLMGEGSDDMYEGFGSIDVEYVSTAYNSNK